MKYDKRILHCIPTMGGGGAERQLGYLCQGLVERGWEVHVALLREGSNIEKLRCSGAAVHKIPSRSHYDPTTISRIHRLIRKVRPKLVQTWIPMMDTVGGIACRLSGVPHIISERNSAPAYPRTIKNRLRIMVSIGACSVISNSPGGDAYWRAIDGRGLRRYVIPNALPLQEINREAPTSIEKIGVQAGQKMVLYAGRFERQKNLESLVEALHEVLSWPQMVAFLCGDGPLHTKIEGMIMDYSLRDRIILPGYVINIWGWMKRADVFVSVSDYEGMPNTVMEAMACGCPVVVSDIPQHRGNLDEKSAIFVPPEDPMHIAAGIRQCLEGGEETEARVRRAMERASQWSIQEMARRYEVAYFEIMESNR